MIKYYVDQEKCIGCSLCAELAPEVFKMDGDKAVGVADDGNNAEEACDSCPVNAIHKSEV